MNAAMPRSLALALVLLVSACSSSPTTPGGSAGAVDAGAGVSADAGGGSDGGELAIPAPGSCGPGSAWAPGAVAFREATEAWGLLATGAAGVRVATGDIDGDGWADLLVRAGGTAADDLAPGGTRRTWLLRNVQGRFEDVTLESGLLATRADQGSSGRPMEVVAFGDVDNDGDLDLYTGTTRRVQGALRGETSELLINLGDGRFELGPIDADLRAEFVDHDAVAGASFVDVDRDGRLDLWVAQAGYTPEGTNGLVLLSDRLYRGDGTGALWDASAALGLVTAPWSDRTALDEGRAHSRAWSAAACDLNGDGTPELLAASYGRAPNLLWQGQRGADGRVSFLNRSVASGYAFDAQVDWRDNEFARCYCAANPAAEGCAGAPRPRIQCGTPNWRHDEDRRPSRLGGNSGTTVCADVDNDGHLDLFTTEITHWWAGQNADRSELLLNSGEPELRFDRAGHDAIGLDRMNPAANWDNGDMTAAIFDFDNDGWPDVYVGASDYPNNRGLLFRQVSSGRFVEVPAAEGIDHHRSHGVAIADFDRDGDLDVIVGHSRSRCDANAPANCYPTRQVRAFENLQGDRGHWIQLALEGGPGTNRAAIGARVSVTSAGVTQTQEVGGGHGHYGLQHDLVLHFGLGEGCGAEVEVRWPDAELTVQRVRVLAGRRYRLRQGESPVVVGR